MMHHGEISEEKSELINWRAFEEARSALGEHFVRLLGYFREDGMKSVATIEEAMHEKNSAKLVLPSHTLKGEAAQFGADQLSLLAEEIEVAARHYVEIQQDPSELIAQVASLRPTFEETLSILERESSPLVQRKPATTFKPQQRGFGSRSFE